MNLLLFDAFEIEAGEALITGRRAEHIEGVLRSRPGDFLRAGIVGVARCTATVIAVDKGAVRVRLGELETEPSPPLIAALSLPRPKALSRCISTFASFGLTKIFLINAWKVEKSYFSSPRLKKERLELDARLGCEQGAQIYLPTVEVVTSFRRFIEDIDSTLLEAEKVQRIVFDPASQRTLTQVFRGGPPPGRARIVAFGPEGGFIDRELRSFEAAGYEAARLETGPLKTEVAIAAALGQLSLLHHLP